MDFRKAGDEVAQVVFVWVAALIAFGFALGYVSHWLYARCM